MSTRVWRDFRVKLSNQKLVFTQLTGLNVGDKTRNFTFQLVLQHNVSGQLALFCCLFKGQTLLHDKGQTLLQSQLYFLAEGKKTLIRE